MPKRTFRHHLVIRLGLPVGFIVGAVATAALVDGITNLEPTDRETAPPSQLDRVLEAHAGECWFNGRAGAGSGAGSRGRHLPGWPRGLQRAAGHSGARVHLRRPRRGAFTVVAFCK